MFQNNLLMAADAATSGTSLVSVGNSALFQEANSEYLSRTPGATGVEEKGTFSGWVYRVEAGAYHYLFTTYVSSTNVFQIYITSNDQLLCSNYSSGYDWQLLTTQLFRDVGWYHIVLAVDTTQAVAGERIILYINGKRVSAFATETYPSLNFVNDFNTASVPNLIGSFDTTPSNEFDGYMAEAVWIDGTQYAATDFGEFDSTGLYWTPLASATIKALTFGTNGFYLDNTTNAETDASGNGNNFTNNNTVTLSTHTPTNVFGFLNPLNSGGIGTLSNGNRTYSDSGATRVMSTMSFPAAGKFYFEGTLASFANGVAFGIAEAGSDGQSTFLGANYAGISVQSGPAGRYYRFSATRNNIPTSGTNALTEVADTLMLAVDCAEGKIWIGFYDDSLDATRWIDASDGYQTGDQPGSGTNATIDLATTLEGYEFAVNSAGSIALTVNMGDVAYTRTAPSGFGSFNTANIAAENTTTASDTNEHWNNLLYTGNGTAIGSGGNAITGAGFQPDFVWLKNRSATDSHQLTDSVRGVTKNLSSDSTAAEGTDAEGLTAFGSDGFTVGSDVSYNTNTESYVAWCAKLGGAPTATNSAGAGATPTAGSVKIDGVNLGSALAGTIPVTKLTANTTLGMSCGTYTGTGSANETIATGLTGCEMIIVKRTDTTYSWAVWNSGLTDDYSMLLNTTAAQVNSGYWDTSGNTSTLIELGTDSEAVNKSGQPYYFMAFAPSQFISIGSYEGNANADGAFVPTLNSLGVPIQPTFILQKNIDGAFHWQMYDTARDPFNVVTHDLYANSSGAEVDAAGGSNILDIVTGGFKCRGTGDPNRANTSIFMAIGTPVIDTDGRIIGGR